MSAAGVAGRLLAGRLLASSSSRRPPLTTVVPQLSSRPLSTASDAKIVVVGGSGFVGSAVCKAAVERGASVFSVSRAGKPASKQIAGSTWASQVTWLQGDALEVADWPEDYLKGAAGVVSCVGSFGTHDFMRKICGEANVRVFDEAGKRGVARAVFIGAHPFLEVAPARHLLRGYYEGKEMAEEALFANFSGGTGTSIRPGMIHGTRYVSDVPVPLSLVGKPLEVIFGNEGVRSAVGSLPLPFGLAGLLVPAASAERVAKAAVEALMGAIPEESHDRRVVDVWALRKQT